MGSYALIHNTLWGRALDSCKNILLSIILQPLVDLIIPNANYSKLYLESDLDLKSVIYMDLRLHVKDWSG